MQQDLVSIIMPSYNTGNFIEESIDSVLSQSYSNWELLIVDDCSTDTTDLIISRFRDPRIRYFKNNRNGGAAFSRNRALREAKGKWIAFLDSDDLWMPDKLEKQIRFMKEHDYHFSYTKYEEINESSDLLGIIVSGPRRVTKSMMYAYCWPGCLTVMYDRDIVWGGLQIADIKKNNDYAMWLKVSHGADCYLLDEILAKYRKRSGSISNHSYRKLILWHYKLFKEVEQKNTITAVMLTFQNLVFGYLKKVFYVKKIKM